MQDTPKLEITAYNYPHFAGLTENAPTGDTPVNPDMALATAMSLQAAVEVGEMVDKIKRALIYKKEFNPLEFLDQMTFVKSDVVVRNSILTPKQYRLLHAALGMLTEAAEFAESVQKHVFLGEPLDEVHMKEEVGDQTWYQAIVMNVFDWNFDGVMTTNIEKLRKRYPQGFTTEKALNRDLTAERQALEGQKQ